jgi:hypothetical protein
MPGIGYRNENLFCAPPSSEVLAASHKPMGVYEIIGDGRDLTSRRDRRPR